MTTAEIVGGSWAQRKQAETWEPAISKIVPWNLTDENYLIEMYHRGVTQPEIAKALYRTYNAVTAKLNSLRKEGRL